MEIELRSSDKIVVIASDGVWEVLSNEKVMEIVSKYYEENNAEMACNELIRVATKEWKSMHDAIDDITAIVIFLSIK